MNFGYYKLVDNNGWYVITGGPYSGKTTMIEALHTLGHTVEEEVARAHIDEELKKGRTIELIRQDGVVFQQAILDRKLQRHATLPSDHVIFFDRGIPDTIAYMRANGLPVTPEMALAMEKYSYQKAFLMDPVGHAIDYARTESPELVARIHEELRTAYEELGIPVVRVPVMLSPQDRVNFILGNL